MLLSSGGVVIGMSNNVEGNYFNDFFKGKNYAPMNDLPTPSISDIGKFPIDQHLISSYHFNPLANQLGRI